MKISKCIEFFVSKSTKYTCLHVFHVNLLLCMLSQITMPSLLSCSVYDAFCCLNLFVKVFCCKIYFPFFIYQCLQIFNRQFQSVCKFKLEGGSAGRIEIILLLKILSIAFFCFRAPHLRILLQSRKCNGKNLVLYMLFWEDWIGCSLRDHYTFGAAPCLLHFIMTMKKCFSSAEESPQVHKQAIISFIKLPEVNQIITL